VLIRLRYAVLGVVIAAAGAGVPAALVTGAVKAGYIRVSHPGAGSARAAGVRAGTRATPFGAFGLSSPRRLIVPDLVAVLPAGLSAAQVGEVGGLAGVRAVLAVDGGRVLIGGRAVSVLGVPVQAFRAWTPPVTAASSTWRIWGTDGFGQTGTPDVMNPLDAVPSAARMLCAGGAASGGLSAAIFGYNHAGWYVSEVLALAGEYAREYS
jgi:hypothetical protein